MIDLISDLLRISRTMMIRGTPSCSQLSADRPLIDANKIIH